MTTVLLDSHVVQWWSAEPDRLSPTAAQTLGEADEVAVASISWFELAWLAWHERIVVSIPIRSWLEGLARQVRTIGTSPAIAAAAVALPTSFSGDPADRIIYATAIEHGWALVTKDRRLRGQRRPRPITSGRRLSVGGRWVRNGRGPSSHRPQFAAGSGELLSCYPAA